MNYWLRNHDFAVHYVISYNFFVCVKRDLYDCILLAKIRSRTHGIIVVYTVMLRINNDISSHKTASFWIY